VLKDLRFSNSETEWIALLVERWQQLGPSMTSEMLKAEEIYAADPWGDQAPTSAVLRTWAASAGRTRLAPLLRLADAFWWADRQAGDPAPYKQTIASVYKRAIKIAYKDAISLSDLALDGNDLEKLGVRGPAVGSTLRKLLEVVITDPRKNNHDELLAIAKSLDGQDGKPKSN
jgi:tRNA nucleotidyltransferase (CCA-adding enzyme)